MLNNGQKSNNLAITFTILYIDETMPAKNRRNSHLVFELQLKLHILDAEVGKEQQKAMKPLHRTDAVKNFDSSAKNGADPEEEGQAIKSQPLRRTYAIANLQDPNLAENGGSLSFEEPVCLADFRPTVDHAHHSGCSKSKYYPVPEGWETAIFTDPAYAERVTNGYTGYVRYSCRTKDEALTVWADHCRRVHGTPCPNAPTTYWGIKNHKVVFHSRADAITFAQSKELPFIHLFGSVKKGEVKAFLGMV
ncbi:hypothetical protein R3P38DRAFT_3205549 [Favolaschia claudopus]|uniref:Uncharacterized protein n=1 Tax=Favolaschia claudopus TaxID=2862362 RepID=A0AAW0AN17_9AGAR